MRPVPRAPQRCHYVRKWGNAPILKVKLGDQQKQEAATNVR